MVELKGSEVRFALKSGAPLEENRSETLPGRRSPTLHWPPPFDPMAAGDRITVYTQRSTYYIVQLRRQDRRVLVRGGRHFPGPHRSAARRLLGSDGDRRENGAGRRKPRPPHLMTGNDFLDVEPGNLQQSLDPLGGIGVAREGDPAGEQVAHDDHLLRRKVGHHVARV